MILSITKLQLTSYSKLPAFFGFNRRIIDSLKGSGCKQFKVTGSMNFKTWYTMTLWENEDDLNKFYRNGVHLEAMKQAKFFSNNMDSKRLNRNEMMAWGEAKKLFV